MATKDDMYYTYVLVNALICVNMKSIRGEAKD